MRPSHFALNLNFNNAIPMQPGSEIFTTFFSFLLFCTVCNAQFQDEYYILKEDTTVSPGELNLYLNGSGFFNNNEFFGSGIKGYTLIGNNFQPVLEYNFTKEFNLRAGTHLLWYHGQDKLRKILPFFSINYKLLPSLKIRIGSYNQGACLRLPEPLYKFENRFASLTGNGIQIIKTGNIWESVTWLNWLTFIEPGDPFREEFVFGHSGKIRLFENGRDLIDLPVYLLANHKGGQINHNDQPVETRTDLGTGINWTRHMNLSLIDRFSLLAHYYYENGIEPNPPGNAFYGYGEMNADLFSLGMGYFHEKNWESILGEPLFFSPGVIDQDEDHIRDLIIFKAGFHTSITSNSSLLLRFEGYYDLSINKFQYTYGIHMILNEWINIFKGNSE